jgi:hypothetical protein
MIRRVGDRRGGLRPTRRSPNEKNHRLLGILPDEEAPNEESMVEADEV